MVFLRVACPRLYDTWTSLLFEAFLWSSESNLDLTEHFTLEPFLLISGYPSSSTSEVLVHEQGYLLLQAVWAETFAYFVGGILHFGWPIFCVYEFHSTCSHGKGDHCIHFAPDPQTVRQVFISHKGRRKLVQAMASMHGINPSSFVFFNQP